ncbi:MAG: hypothetical protein R3D46_16730 [Defluviimonas denitrificans]
MRTGRRPGRRCRRGCGGVAGGDGATGDRLDGHAFANPEVRDGAIDIRCDLKIVRPDGTESSIPESPCAKGALEGDAAALHLDRC